MEKIWKSREKVATATVLSRAGQVNLDKGFGREGSFSNNGNKTPSRLRRTPPWQGESYRGSLEGYMGKALPPMGTLELEGIGEGEI
jgi:hypothetical protein